MTSRANQTDVFISQLHCNVDATYQLKLLTVAFLSMLLFVIEV